MRLLAAAMYMTALVACASDPADDGTDSTSTTASTTASTTESTTASTTESTTESTTGSTTGTPSDYAPFVLRCDPEAADPCAAYGSVTCCSDDPTAIDFGDVSVSATPAYAGRGGVGTPVFSADNNALSRWGYCLSEATPGGLALTEAAAQGCRVPCNPTWSASNVAEVCGAASLCCQAVEIEPEDCIFDVALGDVGCYRPVTGSDIQGLGGSNTTNWSSSDHVTHQDPGGTNCEVFINSLPASTLTDAGLTPQAALLECWRRLTVANQRGSCFSIGELDSCPFADPSYIDACEQLNLDNNLSGCG